MALPPACRADLDSPAPAGTPRRVPGSGPGTAGDEAAQRLARDMPKVLLHEHLDGGLRVATLLELLDARGIPSPAPDVASLARWFDAHAFAHSLELPSTPTAD